MNFRYLLHILRSLALIPVIMFQEKAVRRKIPVLPEADGTEGKAGIFSGKSINLIFIGESSVAGVGVQHHADSLVGQLAGFFAAEFQAEANWKVFAKSKYNAEKVLKILLPQIEEKDADLIVIGTGGNDSFELTAPMKFKANLAKVIQSLQTKFPGVPILFVNFPPVKYFPAFTPQMKSVLGKHTDILAVALEEMLQNYPEVYFMSDNNIFKKWSVEERIPVERFFSDAVHPSAETYRRWAIAVGKFILEKSILGPRKTGL